MLTKKSCGLTNANIFFKKTTTTTTKQEKIHDQDEAAKIKTKIRIQFIISVLVRI